MSWVKITYLRIEAIGSVLYAGFLGINIQHSGYVIVIISTKSSTPSGFLELIKK